MSEIRREVESAVTDYMTRLETRGIHIERVYLFGSSLTGDVDEWSDVDIVTVSRDFARLGFWEVVALLGQAERETLRATGMVVEAHAKTPEEVAACHPASFLADVLQNAVIVYDSSLVPA